jgi:hypothetical protein
VEELDRWQEEGTGEEIEAAGTSSTTGETDGARRRRTGSTTCTEGEEARQCARSKRRYEHDGRGLGTWESAR